MPETLAPARTSESRQMQVFGQAVVAHNLTIAIMEVVSKYRRGMVDNILLGESGSSLTRRTHEFILEQMFFSYEHSYLG